MSCEDVEYDRYLLECYEECHLPKKEGQNCMNGNANFAARSSNAYLGLTSTASQGALWLAF
jgi:hypothetical protein